MKQTDPFRYETLLIEEIANEKRFSMKKLKKILALDAYLRSNKN